MIYEILPVNNYQGNNSTTTFEFDFYIENENQLNVFLFDDSVKTKLKVNVDYSINELKNKNGSYITFPIEGSNYGILSEGQKISLELTLPISQETQYNNSSLLNLQALEYSLDYLTRLIQILARKMALCIKVEECSSNTPDELLDSINEANQNATVKALEAQQQANLALERLNLINEQANIVNQNKEEIERITANQVLLTDRATNCILSAPNGVMTYSGSTITAKTGLRVLLPDGRNEDGTLKNIELTLAQDVTYIEPEGGYPHAWYTIDSIGHISGYQEYFEQEENPERNYSLWYKPSENKMYRITNDVNSPEIVKATLIGFCTLNNGQIQQAYPSLPFALAQKEELKNYLTTNVSNITTGGKAVITSFPFPSKSVNLTIGGSGAGYTTPADGWYYLYIQASSDRGGATLRSPYLGTQVHSWSGQGTDIFLPAAKGDYVYLQYNNINTSASHLHFIYAKGVNNG